MEILLLALSGLIVGTLGTFFGVGGGIIVIPLLTVFFKYPIHEAVATSLLIVLSTSIVTSQKSLNTGMVNLRMGLIIAVTSLLGSIAGGFISIGISEKFLYIILGTVQMLSAMLMLNKNRLPSAKGGKLFIRSEYINDSGLTVTYSVYNVKPLLIISVFNGILSGMVGAGGGVVLVPAMNILADIPIKVATSTSALIMGFMSAGSGIIFFMNGYAQLDVLAAMVPTIYLSSRIASKYFAKVNSKKLSKAFICLIFIVAAQMIYKGLK